MGAVTTCSLARGLAAASTGAAMAGAGAAGAAIMIGAGAWVAIGAGGHTADADRFFAFLDLDFRDSGFLQKLDQLFDLANIHAGSAPLKVLCSGCPRFTGGWPACAPAVVATARTASS